MCYTNSKTFPRWFLLLPSEILSAPLFPSSSRHRKGAKRERERVIGFGSSASIDGGVTSGKDGRGHGNVDPAYADLGRSGV